MKKQVFFMIALFFVAIAVNAQSAKMTSPDTENQEAKTETSQAEVKATSSATGDSINVDNNDDSPKAPDEITYPYARTESGMLVTGPPQWVIDNASTGQKVIIYNPNRDDLGTLNVGKEITIEYDYTEDGYTEVRAPTLQ